MNKDIGTLYVLANRDQSLAKVGMTRDGTPDARASDYERAHGIRWHVYWSAVTRNVAEAEAAAHRELDICRFALVPGAREVFHVTPQKAKRVAERYIVPPSGWAQPPGARSVWLGYGEVLVSAASAALVGTLTARIRQHRYVVISTLTCAGALTRSIAPPCGENPENAKTCPHEWNRVLRAIG